MLIEKAIRDYLEEKDTGAGSRIYPLILPQKPVYPALTYQVIVSGGHHDIPVDYPRIQITSWAETLLAAKTLSLEVREALERFCGILGGYRIKQIVCVGGPGDLFDKDAGVRGLYYVPVDYRILYER